MLHNEIVERLRTANLLVALRDVVVRISDALQLISSREKQFDVVPTLFRDCGVKAKLQPRRQRNYNTVDRTYFNLANDDCV